MTATQIKDYFPSANVPLIRTTTRHLFVARIKLRKHERAMRCVYALNFCKHGSRSPFRATIRTKKRLRQVNSR